VGGKIEHYLPYVLCSINLPKGLSIPRRDTLTTTTFKGPKKKISLF